jgi:hypothetical protein
MNRRMLVAGVGVLCVTAALIGPARPAQTEAAWTASQVASAAVTASTLPTPNITGCVPSTYVVVLVGAVFKEVALTWTSPLGPEAGWEVAFAGKASDPPSPITPSGPSNGLYTYTTTYSSDILTSLVANLLGGTTTIAISATQGTKWKSVSATKKLKIALLGLNPTCT